MPRLPVLMVSLKKRTDPSAIDAMTPPGWKLLGDRMTFTESALPLLSSVQLGEFGGNTDVKPTRSAWPSVQSEPKYPLSWMPEMKYWPSLLVKQTFGVLVILATVMAVP